MFLGCVSVCVCVHTWVHVYIHACVCPCGGILRSASCYISSLWSLLCVRVLDTLVSPAKTDEPIYISFRMWLEVCPRNHLLHGSQDLTTGIDWKTTRSKSMDSKSYRHTLALPADVVCLSAVLLTSRCHIKFYSFKNLPLPWNVAFSQITLGSLAVFAVVADVSSCFTSPCGDGQSLGNIQSAIAAVTCMHCYF